MSDDDALSALLDGALSTEETARIERRLAAEPDLRARLHALQRANDAVREAFRSVVEEPLPPKVLALLGADETAASKVVSLPTRRQRSWNALPLAAAASVALAIGIAIGVALDGPGGPDAAGQLAVSGIVRSGALYDVFNDTPSGTTRRLPGDVAATPVLTFATVSGEYCRRVDLASAEALSMALACRRADGWRLEAVTFEGPIQRSPDGVYRPASQPSAPIDAAIDSLLAGDVLGSDEELALIEAGWSEQQ